MEPPRAGEALVSVTGQAARAPAPETPDEDRAAAAVVLQGLALAFARRVEVTTQAPPEAVPGSHARTVLAREVADAQAAAASAASKAQAAQAALATAQAVVAAKRAAVERCAQEVWCWELTGGPPLENDD